MNILKPIVHETVWGGSRLTAFSGSTSEKIGHLYCFIDSEQFSNEIIAGENKGKNLHQWFIANRDRFGLMNYDRLPFLSALVDATDNLSIQVHPDDLTAKKLEEAPFGKNESFYILEPPTSGKMFNGVLTDDVKKFEEAVRKGETLKYVDSLECKAGDYIYVIGGTLHAAAAGTLSFEIEENCEHTYRFFDFNRKDKKGNPRPLQIDKALISVDLSKKSKAQKAGSLFVERLYWSQLTKPNGAYKNTTDSFLFLVSLDKNINYQGLVIMPGTAILLDPQEEINVGDATVICVGPSGTSK